VERGIREPRELAKAVLRLVSVSLAAGGFNAVALSHNDGNLMVAGAILILLSVSLFMLSGRIAELALRV